MFNSILDAMTSTLGLSDYLVCSLISLLCGLILAFIYKKIERPSKNFLITLVFLPIVVQNVIWFVNDDIGVGIAVAGSFSLVRFRSLPGKSSDILVIFLAMALGLCTSMGFVVLALFLAIVIGLLMLVFMKLPIFDGNDNYRCLRITIPEDLDYTSVFDDLFEKYTTKNEVVMVKTLNLGTMFQLTYNLTLKNPKDEKEFLDELRVRNGNLALISSKQALVTDTL